jgi:hypothetical protein
VSGYGVYVIQLKSCANKEALGALYVGSSWCDPSERMRQHDEGCETGAVGLHGQCRRLRPELYLDLPWCWDRRDAFASEHDRARRLADAGFLVRCDGRVHRPAAQRVAFSDTELETVAEQFEHILLGLLGSARRQLSVDDLVHALRWTARAPSVSELVAVPNDYIGRFSHVDELAVHGAAKTILRRRFGNDGGPSRCDPESARPG